MTSPALHRLHDSLPVLSLTQFDAWAQAQDHGLLFFAGDPARYPESHDVAVILPELLKRFAGCIAAALVDPEAEPELQARYRFDAWPALVLLRRGAYLGAITRIHSWAEYVAELETLLSSETKPLPGFKIPVVAEPAERCH
jgi:hydrogenase-1 operon protein HyaE